MLCCIMSLNYTTKNCVLRRHAERRTRFFLQFTGACVTYNHYFSTRDAAILCNLTISSIQDKFCQVYITAKILNLEAVDMNVVEGKYDNSFG